MTFLAGLLLVVSASVAQSQQFDEQTWASDLAAVAPYLNRDNLSNGEVAQVAAIACGALREARHTRVLLRLERLMQEQYPNRSVMGQFEKNPKTLGEFLDFERKILRDAGVDRDAANAIVNFIGRSPNIPVTPPKNGTELVERLRVVESTACDLRITASRRSQNETARSNDQSTARALVTGVVGVGVMVVDAGVAVSVSATGIGALPATVLAMVSGGWGWNRVEAAISKLSFG
jgi:hypothetical protein